MPKTVSLVHPVHVRPDNLPVTRWRDDPAAVWRCDRTPAAAGVPHNRRAIPPGTHFGFPVYGPLNRLNRDAPPDLVPRLVAGLRIRPKSSPLSAAGLPVPERSLLLFLFLNRVIARSISSTTL